MSDGSLPYKEHWEIGIFLTRYPAAPNKIEILPVRRKGGMDIGKLATSATTVYWIPTGGMYFLCKNSAGW